MAAPTPRLPQVSKKENKTLQLIMVNVNICSGLLAAGMVAWCLRLKENYSLGCELNRRDPGPNSQGISCMQRPFLALSFC